MKPILSIIFALLFAIPLFANSNVLIKCEGKLLKATVTRSAPGQPMGLYIETASGVFQYPNRCVNKGFTFSKNAGATWIATKCGLEGLVLYTDLPTQDGVYRGQVGWLNADGVVYNNKSIVDLGGGLNHAPSVTCKVFSMQ